MKLIQSIAAVALLGSVLAGCGGENAAYCDDLKAAKSSFDGVESGNAADIEKAFDTFHNLADEAPSDVEADWKKLDGAITTVEKGLQDAGIELSQLDELQSGQLPEGVDPAKLQEAVSGFSELNGQEFTDASEAITKHAKDECDVNLDS